MPRGILNGSTRCEGIITSAGYECQRRTHLKGPVRDVLLLDTIGELRAFYALCDIAFVGGSLVKVGGHNLLEPAAMKKPVIFSRYMFNFKEISEALMSSGGGVMVKDKGELYAQFDSLLSDPERAKLMGERAFRVIEANSGLREEDDRCYRKAPCRALNHTLKT